MTVHISKALSGLGLSGPLNDNELAVTIGHLDLVAGSASEVLPASNRHSSDAHVYFGREATGGALGTLTGTWTKATNTVAITSSSGTDTSRIAYLLLG